MKYIILLLVLLSGCIGQAPIEEQTPEISIVTPTIEVPTKTPLSIEPIMYIYLIENDTLISSYIVKDGIFIYNPDWKLIGEQKFELNYSYTTRRNRIIFNTPEGKIRWVGDYIVSDYPLIGDEWPWN